MKYFEVNEPNYALIKAPSKSKPWWFIWVRCRR